MLSIYISTLDIIVKVDTSRYLLTMLHWPESGQNIKKNPKTSQPTYSTLSQVWGEVQAGPTQLYFYGQISNICAWRLPSKKSFSRGQIAIFVKKCII